MTKSFHIGAILSVTGEALMCPIGDVYEILNYMTDDNLFTHQLPRVARECRPVLLKQQPQLSAWVDDVTPENYKARLADAIKQFGEELSVEPLAANEHEYIDPMSELAEKIHPDKIIPVVI